MHTLIAFSTKHGFTEHAAFKLQQLFGDQAECVNLKTTFNVALTDYQTVIIGGSIYFGKIQPEVAQFLEQQRAELASKKIGLFLGGEDAQRQLYDAFGAELLQRAAAVELIGGIVNPKQLNFGEKIITKIVSKVKKEADPIDLDAVLTRLANTLR